MRVTESIVGSSEVYVKHVEHDVAIARIPTTTFSLTSTRTRMDSTHFSELQSVPDDIVGQRQEVARVE